MFNYGGTTGNFSAKRVTRGITPGDSDSYRTLYCGMSFLYSNWPFCLQVSTRLTPNVYWSAKLLTTLMVSTHTKRREFPRILNTHNQECTQFFPSSVTLTCRRRYQTVNSKQEESSDHSQTWLDSPYITDRPAPGPSTFQSLRTL